MHASTNSSAKLSPAARKVSDQLEELGKAGITDRGGFRPLSSSRQVGFAEMFFRAPEVSKLPRRKLLSNEGVKQLKIKRHKTELALNIRDAMVAELAKVVCNTGIVKTLASNLLLLGVELSPKNWAIGRAELNHAGVREYGELLEYHSLLAYAVCQNLDRLMAGLTPEEDKNGTLEIFARLHSGLSPSINQAQIAEAKKRYPAAEAEAAETTTTTTTATSKAPTATTTTTTTATTAMASVTMTGNFAETVSKYQTSIAQPNSTVKLPNATERLQLGIGKTQEAIKKHWATLDRFLAQLDANPAASNAQAPAGKGAVTWSQYHKIVSDLDIWLGVLEREQTRYEEILVHEASKRSNTSMTTTALHAEPAGQNNPFRGQGPHSKAALLKAQIKAATYSKDLAVQKIQDYEFQGSSKVSASEKDAAEKRWNALKVEIKTFEDALKNIEAEEAN
ncbi:MAG: hypothetical protein Q7T87_22090 [Polaromonas sp.]|nr:hypothetical protein [Polaromonas sp.]